MYLPFSLFTAFVNPFVCNPFLTTIAAFPRNTDSFIMQEFWHGHHSDSDTLNLAAALPGHFLHPFGL